MIHKILVINFGNVGRCDYFYFIFLRYIYVYHQFLFTSYSIRQNYIINHGNVSAINFSILSSLALIPIMTAMLDPLFGFENTLLISYSNKMEPFLLSATIMIICALFFAGKKSQRKSGIKSYGLLIALSVSLSLSAYTSSKLIQTYHPFMTSTFVSLSVSMPFWLFLY